MFPNKNGRDSANGASRMNLMVQVTNRALLRKLIKQTVPN